MNLEESMAVGLCVFNKEKNFDSIQELFVKQSFILENIFSFSNDAIVVLNHKKHIVMCSKKFQYWFKEQEVLGESFLKLMNKITQLPDDFFKEKSYFIKVKDKDTEKVLKAKISKYYKDYNKIDRYVVILKDVTEQKEMKAQKDNFIATLTHDLKTPVRADILSLELLLNGKFGELNFQQKEILGEILNSNKFMMSMLDTLLAKYKYESDMVQLNKSFFDLNLLVENCTKELKYLFAEKNITLKLELSSEKLEIYADFIEMKRAINNLISNAIKFNKQNGLVTISTNTNEKNCEIKVKDTGIGMNEEKILHIFDKYVSYAKRFRRLGTGLGLYVAKKIIEAHKGTIEVTSVPKKGSVFLIKLPECLKGNID